MGAQNSSQPQSYQSGQSPSGPPPGIGQYMGGPIGGPKNAGPPPDYNAAAQQQFQSGQQSVNQQTQANRPNISTPFGSEQWTKDANGNWTMNTSFAPGLQGAVGNLQGQISGQGPLDNGSQARDQAIQAAYGQAASRLDPRFTQEQDQLQSQLAAQGLAPGSAAYDRAMGNFSREKNDAYSSAMNGAIGQGTAAQQATFGENLAAQMAPYQQMGMLQGGLSMPGFDAAGAYSPLQSLFASQLSGNYGLQSAQMQNQILGDIFGGAGQLGGAAIMASDERIKTNVRRLPVEAAPGIPLATYKYKHAPEKGHMLGVIAQDVEKVRPDAVQEDEAGIKRVDYSKLRPFGVK